jgi:hypothetical protein
MTRKQSYSDGAACVLDCGGCDAALKSEISNFKSAANGVLPLQRERGAHASRVPYSASRRISLPQLPTLTPLLDGKLTLAAKLTSKSNRNPAISDRKNESAIALPVGSTLRTTPRLPKAIEGYPSLLKPIFKNFFYPRYIFGRLLSVNIG